MQFNPITTARVNFDDEYIVKLKDGTYAFARLHNQGREGKEFTCINFSDEGADENNYRSWQTSGVIAVAKLPKGKLNAEITDPESLEGTVK